MCPLSFCLSIRLSICLSVCLSVYLSICLSVYPSIRLSVYPSIRLSVYPSIRLSVYPLLLCRSCLSIYPSNLARSMDRGMISPPMYSLVISSREGILINRTEISVHRPTLATCNKKSINKFLLLIIN